MSATVKLPAVKRLDFVVSKIDNKHLPERLYLRRIRLAAQDASLSRTRSGVRIPYALPKLLYTT
jgi:hypothetical protein